MPKPPFILREADRGDIAIIGAIASATWPVAYKEVITRAQIDYMLEMMYAPQALERQMQDGHRFLLAGIDEEACGFCSFGPKPGAEDVVRLHKLYILPQAQGKGVGGTLISGMEERLPPGFRCLELNVNKRNPAYRFYLKQGFEVTGEVVLPFGPYVMDDYIMSRLIRKIHAA